MSMMQRLRAIRARMASQPGGTENLGARPEVPAAVVARPDALRPSAEALPPRGQGAGSARSTVNMWNMLTEDDMDLPPPLVPPSARQPEAVMPAPAPAAPQQAAVPPEADSAGPHDRRSGRVKTRLLSATPGAGSSLSALSRAPRFSVGFVVVVAGPGRGNAIPLAAGVSQIGRGESQQVRLNFGDDAISNENHAALAYDEEQAAFFVGPGSSPNPIILNGRRLLGTQPISHGDEIALGETTLRLVATCGRGFSWGETVEHAGTIQ